jgi:hypothetical protein
MGARRREEQEKTGQVVGFSARISNPRAEKAGSQEPDAVSCQCSVPETHSTNRSLVLCQGTGGIHRAPCRKERKIRWALAPQAIAALPDWPRWQVFSKLVSQSSRRANLYYCGSPIGAEQNRRRSAAFSLRKRHLAGALRLHRNWRTAAGRLVGNGPIAGRGDQRAQPTRRRR